MNLLWKFLSFIGMAFPFRQIKFSFPTLPPPITCMQLTHVSTLPLKRMKEKAGRSSPNESMITTAVVKGEVIKRLNGNTPERVEHEAVYRMQNPPPLRSLLCRFFNDFERRYVVVAIPSGVAVGGVTHSDLREPSDVHDSLFSTSRQPSVEGTLLMSIPGFML